jgi:O-antigen/teichoic acid export membrane protein
LTVSPTRSQAKRISYNALFQICGQILPVAAAALAVPGIYRNIGRSSFGIFTIVLSAIGFLSVMDLGLGRSTVRYLSRDFARKDLDHAASVLAQAIAMLGGISLFATVILLCLAPYASGSWIASGELSAKTLHGTLFILIAAVPFLGTSSVFRSVLEANEDFLRVSIVQTVLGTMTYLVPLGISFFSRDIRVITAGAVACRIATFAAFCIFAFAYWNGKFPWSTARVKLGGEFQQFSSWLVLSNLIGSGIVYGDRAVLAKLIPLGEIAFYNVPLELLGRILILVNGVASAGFPFLSRLSDYQNRLPDLYRIAAIGLSGVMGIGFYVLGLLAPYLVSAWLGDDFRNHSVVLIRIFSVGLAFQSLNILALASLNASGSSKLPAIMHAIEAPLYLVTLIWGGTHYGAKGIAWIWAARPGIEFLFYCGFISAMAEHSGIKMALTVASFAILNSGALILLALNMPWQLTLLSCAVSSSIWIVWIVLEYRRKTWRNSDGREERVK